MQNPGMLRNSGKLGGRVRERSDGDFLLPLLLPYYKLHRLEWEAGRGICPAQIRKKAAAATSGLTVGVAAVE